MAITPPGSDPVNSRESCKNSRHSGQPSGAAGADCHLIGYQSFSRKGASTGADRHLIGYRSFSRKGASVRADRHLIGYHSFSRTGVFYHRAVCIFLSLCHTNFSYSFQGLNLSELLSFDPASIGSAILEVDDRQPQPIGVSSQLLRIKGLLSVPIDALV
jgi:hypothetical protein